MRIVSYCGLEWMPEQDVYVPAGSEILGLFTSPGMPHPYLYYATPQIAGGAERIRVYQRALGQEVRDGATFLGLARPDWMPGPAFVVFWERVEG